MPTGRRSVAIIGAGAAGLMAAIHAATAGAEVLLIERMPEGGRKIIMSGGGRCNLLPAQPEASRFITAGSPRSVRKIISSWPAEKPAAFFTDEVGVKLATETASGKIFPVSNRAREVRDKLLQLARRRGVRLLAHTLVTGMTPATAGWQLTTATGTVTANAVIVATGGLSFPETGSDGSLWPLLAQLGHTMVPAYPALTPLLSDDARLAALAGVALDATVRVAAGATRAVATGGFLFTHHGFSGPAVLEISHHLARARLNNLPAEISICWTRHDAAAWRKLLHAAAARPLLAVLRGELPERLAAMLCASSGLAPDRSVAQLRRDERERLIAALTRFTPTGVSDAGYRAAEVTGGGLSLAEINPATMESRMHPRLFIAGEILDVFGLIGGYNLLWAWTTGRLAGRAAAK